MALVKSMTFPTGETGEYWRLIEVNNNTLKEKTRLAGRVHLVELPRLRPGYPLPQP